MALGHQTGIGECERQQLETCGQFGRQHFGYMQHADSSGKHATEAGNMKHFGYMYSGLSTHKQLLSSPSYSSLHGQGVV